jgi:hypothetical protein
MSAVSVVMALYNGERFLREQVESVLRELLLGDEFIIIVDAATDSSLDILQDIVSPTIQVYENFSNLGVVASFERGLKLATNEYIFLCDQDDVWLPGKRTAFVAAFERDPQTLVVVSDAQLIDGNGVITALSFMATRGGFRGTIWNTLVRNRYLGCAMALRRELILAALPIPRWVPMHDMWLGALGSILGRVHYISTPLMQYRRHGSNVSPSRHQGWSRMLRWRLALLTALAGRLYRLALGRHTPTTTPALPGRPKA